MTNAPTNEQQPQRPETAERPAGSATVPPAAPARTHANAEAFRLMLFSSEDGRELESIWNSRDGVAPFIAVSRDNARQLRHVLWGGDPYAPHHVPNVGDRMFIDVPSEQAVRLAEATVERCWNDPATLYRTQFADKAAAVAALTEELSKPGSPTLVTVNADVQQALLQRRSETAQLLQRRHLDARQGIPRATGTAPVGEVPLP